MIRPMNGIALTLAGVATAVALAACGKGESPTSPPTPSTSSGSSATTPPPTSSSSTSPAPGASASASPSPTAAASASPSGDSAAAAAGPGASASAPGASVTTASAGGSGEDTYNKTCMACHGTGAAGAPKIGDKGDWGPRVAQGKPTLYDHAIKGFTGQKGAMPPKGGAAQLSDDEVKAAVDYMVSKAS